MKGHGTTRGPVAIGKRGVVLFETIFLVEILLFLAIFVNLALVRKWSRELRDLQNERRSYRGSK